MPWGPWIYIQPWVNRKRSQVSKFPLFSSYFPRLPYQLPNFIESDIHTAKKHLYFPRLPYHLPNISTSRTRKGKQDPSIDMHGREKCLQRIYTMNRPGFIAYLIARIQGKGSKIHECIDLREKGPKSHNWTLHPPPCCALEKDDFTASTSWSAKQDACWPSQQGQVSIVSQLWQQHHGTIKFPWTHIMQQEIPDKRW